MISFLYGQVIARDEGSIVVYSSGVGYGLQVTSQTLSQCDPSRGALMAFWVHTHISPESLRLFGFTSYEEHCFFALLLGLPAVGPKLALGILSTLSPQQIRTAAHTEDAITLQSVPGIGKKKAQKLILELSSKLEKQPVQIQAQLWSGPLIGSQAETASASQASSDDYKHSTSEDPTAPVLQLYATTDRDGQSEGGGSLGPNDRLTQLNSVSGKAIQTNSGNLHHQDQRLADVHSALKNLGYRHDNISWALHHIHPLINERPSITLEELLKMALAALRPGGQSSRTGI